MTKNYPSLRRARFWMTFGQEYLTHLRVIQNIGMASIEPINYKGMEVVPLEFLKAVLPDPGSLGDNYSGETSIGKYPTQVIQTMTKIITSVENSPLIVVPEKPPHVKTNRYITKSVCYHAANMANEINAKAICTLTNSGYTAFQISAWRPNAHILAFTSNKAILSRLSLLWGVKAIYYDKYVSTDDTVIDVNKIALERGFVKNGDYLINLAAMPIVKKGMVNTLRVSIAE